MICYQAQHPDAAKVVAGDFNRANLKKVMRRALMRVNTRKAAGPDGISG